jgi:hypothetical protein
MDGSSHPHRAWRRIPFGLVVEMVQAGKAHDDVAKRFGVPVRKAKVWIQKARRDGLLPRREPAGMAGRHYADNMYRRHKGPRLGSFENLLGPLDRPLLDWLIDETPKGATIADTVRAIVIDAYHEHKGETDG